MNPPSLVITEAAFQRQIIELARLRGFKVFHVYDSRKSTGTGWPDLSLVRPKDGRYIAAELKVGKNQPTRAQLDWLVALNACGVETHIWRPADLDYISEVLR